MSDVARVEADFWAQRLGCGVTAFERPGLTLVPHWLPGRLYVFAVGRSLVVAGPETVTERLRRLPDPGALVTPEALRPFLPEGAVLVGPARIAYLHRPIDSPAGIERIESLTDSRLAGLRAQVGAEAWEHANLEAAEPPLFAAVAGGEIAAACGFERLADRVAHIGVTTDARRRSRGLGRAVVQAAAAHALSLGLLPQYQTLASNAPALRIAESLGFEPFAVTLAARFSAAAPSR